MIRSRHRTLGAQSLEERVLLAGDGAGLVAVYRGVARNGEPASFALDLAGEHVAPAVRGDTLVSFYVQGSGMDAGAAQVRRHDGTTVAPRVERADLPDADDSLAIFQLSAGQYVVTAIGEQGAVGPLVLHVGLTGDANGNRHVTIDDVLAVVHGIRQRVRGLAAPAAADIDGNGIATIRDLLLTVRNVGAKFSLGPLQARAVAARDATQVGEIFYAPSAETNLTLHTTPGAKIKLLNGNATGPTGQEEYLADAQGKAVVAANLGEGLNTFRFRVTDPLGQQQTLTVQVVRLAPGEAPPPAPQQYNRAITTDPGVQQMPSVAVNPLDPEHVVIAYMDYSLPTADADVQGEGYAGIAVAVSHNGGATWRHSALAIPEPFDQGAHQPIARFDDRGHAFVIFAAATFVGPKPHLTHPDFFNPERNASDREFGFQAHNGVFVARSDDGGVTWNEPAAVDAERFEGTEIAFRVFPDLAVDTFPRLPDGRANPNYGNVYASWSRLYPLDQFPGHPEITGGADIYVAVSRDLGQTWEIQLQDQEGVAVTVIQDPENTLGLPGLAIVDSSQIAVGPEGDIYVTHTGGGDFAIHYSNDGGASFAGPDRSAGRRVAFGGGFTTAAGAAIPNNNFRVRPMVRQLAADPVRPGYVYAVEVFLNFDSLGNEADSADVIFARSLDYGETWEQAFRLGNFPASRLNDDNDGQRATGFEPDEVTAPQVLPRLAIDAEGNLSVVWYDTRRDPANHLLDVFGTLSTDGGATFRPNFRLTDFSFDADQGAFANAIGQREYALGDFIGVALASNSAYAAWTDTRNGNQDIFFARYAADPPPAPLNDRFEPNNAPDATSPTHLGLIVERYLPKLVVEPGDEDWFLIEAAATGFLTVLATGELAGERLQLELWSQGGAAPLAVGTDRFSAGGASIGKQLTSPSAAGQKFLVRVASAAGASATRYALELQSLTEDLGSRVHGEATRTAQVGDVFYYRWEAAAAGSLAIALQSAANVQGDFRLELVDRDGRTVLASGESLDPPGAGETELANLAVQKRQVIYLRISGEPGSQGDFAVQFTNLDQFTTSENSALLFLAGGAPSQAALGDLNRDQILDVVVSDALRDTVNVLLGNGNGTFQTPRQFAVGAYVTPPGDITARVPLGRDVAIAKLNDDDIPDLVVTNFGSSDVSVLLGRGDGTFEPQRRFDATFGPVTLDVGDLNRDGILDLVVASSATPRQTFVVATLLGRGNGTFLPQQTYEVPSAGYVNFGAPRIADINGDNAADIIVSGANSPAISVLLGSGDGVFAFGGQFASARLGAGVTVGDVNRDGHVDVVNTGFDDLQGIALLLGDGQGGFQEPLHFFAGQNPVAVELADLVSQIDLPDGSTQLGPPDGLLDAIVAVSGVAVFVQSLSAAQVVVLPGLADEQGDFIGFGEPHPLAPADVPHDIDIGDLDGDGMLDIVAVERGGVLVIYGQPPKIQPNTTPATARDLGTVVHYVAPTQTITPVAPEAFFTLTVPGEVVAGAGDQVLDFSALFTSEVGPGLSMEVRNAAGSLLGAGERFRVRAAQGEQLQVRIFGLEEEGQRGYGAYTLAIAVLPQVAAVEAHALLPGEGGRPGGPTTSIILSLQGDRLQRETAEDVTNYVVAFLGADGVAGTADDVTIPVAQAVYGPSSNVDVTTGTTRPTAIKQTVTLLFDQALPAGDYRIQVSPGVQAAAFSEDELGLLAPRAGFTGHPVVSRADGAPEGADLLVRDLVFASLGLGDFRVFGEGTRFLKQLHDDLSAVLDAFLTRQGDAPGATQALLDQVLARITPALAGPDGRLARMLVIVLDPVSVELEDSDGDQLFNYDLTLDDYNLATEGVYVDVTYNIELIVIPEPDDLYEMTVDDVPPTARAGALLFDYDEIDIYSWTDDLRAGQTTFYIYDDDYTSS